MNDTKQNFYYNSIEQKNPVQVKTQSSRNIISLINKNEMNIKNKIINDKKTNLILQLDTEMSNRIKQRPLTSFPNLKEKILSKFGKITKNPLNKIDTFNNQPVKSLKDLLKHKLYTPSENSRLLTQSSNKNLTTRITSALLSSKNYAKSQSTSAYRALSSKVRNDNLMNTEENNISNERINTEDINN